jgi:stage V sporulation protein S
MAARVRESGQAQAQAVGAGAVNQAVKAIALARDYLKADGIDLVCRPALREIDIDGVTRTAVVLDLRRHGDH